MQNYKYNIAYKALGGTLTDARCPNTECLLCPGESAPGQPWIIFCRGPPTWLMIGVTQMACLTTGPTVLTGLLPESLQLEPRRQASPEALQAVRFGNPCLTPHGHGDESVGTGPANTGPAQKGLHGCSWPEREAVRLNAPTEPTQNLLSCEASGLLWVRTNPLFAGPSPFGLRSLFAHVTLYFETCFYRAASWSRRACPITHKRVAVKDRPLSSAHRSPRLQKLLS